MDKQEEKTYQAGITIFLSLMLVILLSFLGTFLESAHIAAVRSQAASACDSAMGNLFSYYEKSLYDKYKILALDGRQPAQTILQADMDWYHENEQNYLCFKTKKAEVVEKQFLLDNHGEALYKEAGQIISADMIAAAKKMLSEQTESLSQSTVFTENMNLLTRQSSTLAEISEILKDMDISIETYNRTLRQLKEYLQGISKEHYIQSDESRDKIKMHIIQLLDESGNIKKYAMTYHQKRQETASAISTVQDTLNREELDQNYKDILHEELKAIRELTTPEGTVYQSVEAQYQKAQKQIYILERIQKAFLAELDAADGYQILKENITGCTELSTVSPEIEEKQEIKAGIELIPLFKTIKTIAENGVLGVVLDDSETLSSRTVAAENLPSKQMKEKTENTKNLLKQKIEDSVDNLVWNIYLEQYFDCYTDGNAYDLEYVLGGKNTDKENLKKTVEQLVLMRQAMNLVYLLGDESKKLQARSAAGALFAFTANPAVIQAMSMVILTAWAYAEAVSDVRILMYGGKINFRKDSSQWRLSLQDAVYVENWKVSKKKIASFKQGLAYREYLRILLFFHSKENNLYRGCDMIQWNICRQDPDFRLDSCIYKIKSEFRIAVSPLFVSMQQILRGNEYIYEHSEQKSYS